MEKKYNTRSPGVKRLMKEAIELREPTSLYAAQPLEENLFEWHFTIRGPPGSDYEGGVYHGRIIFPPEYPMKPPSIALLTPNGRFSLGEKICLSTTSYHPELWQPSWGVRTMLLALIGFMPTDGQGTIGSLNCTPEDRQRLARRSLDWSCSVCSSCNRHALLEPNKDEQEKKNIDEEMEEIMSKMTIKSEAEVDIQFKQQQSRLPSLPKPASTTPPSSRDATPSPSDFMIRRRISAATPDQTQILPNIAVDTPTQSHSWVSLIVIIVVAMCIGLLLIRRLYSLQ